MKAKTSTIANKYLKISNYNIDAKTVELQLETHPDYPSFKSISDTFDYLEVENLAAQVPVSLLDELPNSFISIIEIDNQKRLYLTEKVNGNVIITNDNLEKQKISQEYFKEIWNGMIIAIEENNQQVLSKISLKLDNVGATFACLILLVTTFYNSALQTSIYTVLSILGLFISFFIVKEAFGIHNKTVAKVCEKVSKNQGCTRVINNINSKLFNKISLSDASIIYFLVNMVTLLTIGFNYSLSLCIAALSLPVVLFSIYYQGAILKQWCALCIGISTILIAKFILLLSTFNNVHFDFQYTIRFSFLFFLISFLWYQFKNLWLQKSNLSKKEIEFFKFKRDPELFKIMLHKKSLTNIDVIPAEYQITFGSDNPLVVINAVTNPLCGFCVESFQVYQKLLSTNKHIQINLIFSVSDDIKNNDTQISATILDIYYSKGKETALQALSEWYQERDISAWKIKYNSKSTIKETTLSVLKTHKYWLDTNDIHYTPATFINNHHFPKSYNIEDLFLFIDDMLLEKNSDQNNIKAPN